MLVTGFTPWQHMQSGDRSATDEVFMAAQEAVGAHRDSQGKHQLTMSVARWHHPSWLQALFDGATKEKCYIIREVNLDDFFDILKGKNKSALLMCNACIWFILSFLNRIWTKWIFARMIPNWFLYSKSSTFGVKRSIN